MSENNCYLCQEPKSVVGHNTQSCPKVKCKKCGQKGHILRNCSNLNLNMDQKSDGNICLRAFETKKSALLHNGQNKTLDKDIEFSDDVKFEVNETLKIKRSGIDQKPNLIDPIMPNGKEIIDFLHDIEFLDDIKPKLEIKEEQIDMKSSSVGIKRKSELMQEEILGVKSSKIDQKPGQVDPIMSKEMLDFTHDIELSGDVKPKLEIKEGTLKMKNEISEKPKTTRFICEICNVITDQAGIDLHMTGKRHSKNKSKLVNFSTKNK